VAALNTSAEEASGSVFLRVLHDALFSGPGAADLLLPRRPLGELLPDAALRWLEGRGVTVCLGRRVGALEPAAGGWCVDSDAFDHVVLACSAAEAARLAEPHVPHWALVARALRYEPIVTVTVDGSRAGLAAPMVSLPRGPAQFVFDHGQISNTPGRLAFVISGAQHWVDAGLAATETAVLEQMWREFPQLRSQTHAQTVTTLAEKRATFRCTPGLQRPPRAIAPGLVAAGDYTDGPYPATLEGAVRAGEAAARTIDT
jgi:hydroxysqualene dehydroxylase